MLLGPTHTPLSSSFLGLPYRILNTNHKKELLRGLWVGLWLRVSGFVGLGLGEKLKVEVFNIGGP